jgi:hypothetical protein
VPTSIEGRARLRGWAWRAVALVGLLASGCRDSGGRLPLHPASGRVLIDGEPAEGVQVRLHPMDRLADPNALQPFAATGADGSFRLGTYEAGDGAPAGRYKATLFWPDRPPGPSRPIDRLDGTYNDAARSGLDVAIAEGPNELQPFAAHAPAKPARAGRRTPKSARPDVDGLGEGAPR